MKKSIMCIITTVLLLVIMLVSAFVHIPLAIAADENPTAGYDHRTANEVITQVIKWLKGNYEEFYDLRNLHADIIRVFENDSEIKYTVAITCETLLKYENATDLPFVKGLESALTEKNLQASERAAVDAYINGINANIGVYNELAVDLVVVIDKVNRTAPWAMYYQDGMETTLYEIDTLILDAKQMYNAGQRSANEILESASESVDRGYSNYKRIAARDYALEYSSSPTQCYDDGTTCGILQDRTKWNNSVYPYHTIFKHNDCANFVSQAMSAGNLPEGGAWFRTKYVTTQSWGAAWTSVSSMEAFMTDSNRRYWDASNFAMANAGNILLTSNSHVVMITLNDSVLHRYTAHTNDRRNYLFNDNSAYRYYVIKTT